MNELRYRRWIRLSRSARGPGKMLPTNATSYCLAHVVLAVDLRVARQRQPGRGRDADAAEQVGAVALGGEDDVEAGRLFAAAVEVEVRVDGPEGTGPQVGRQVIPQAVVDIQIQVEALSGDAIQRHGLEMLDLDESLERPVAIDAGRLGPQDAVKDQGNATDLHGHMSRSSVVHVANLPHAGGNGHAPKLRKRLDYDYDYDHDYRDS